MFMSVFLPLGESVTKGFAKAFPKAFPKGSQETSSSYQTTSKAITCTGTIQTILASKYLHAQKCTFRIVKYKFVVYFMVYILSAAIFICLRGIHGDFTKRVTVVVVQYV